MMNIAKRLAELGIVLPRPASPVAAYVPAVEWNGMLHLSGQLPFSEEGALILGRLGDTMEIQDGVAAARACAIMILAQAQAFLGTLDRVRQVVRLGVFVNSAGTFQDQPKVANGASELMEQVFGIAGRHARSAVGVSSLPLGVAVEVDAVLGVERG